MSVLIKGMKMPESCSRCELVGDGSDAVFSWSCPFVGEIYKIGRLTKGRLDDCPLVEIPTPHGRLIDADRLLRTEIKHLYYHLPNGDTAIPIIDVEHAPTIIEAEGEE